MSLNEYSLEKNFQRKVENHKQIPKIYLYIGELDSDKERNLATAVKSFNSTYESGKNKFQQVSARYEPIENNSNEKNNQTQKNRYKLRLTYKTERDEKAKYFLRNYYPFFNDFFIEGTIFIDYLYVVILNIGGKDIPFIINGPIINLKEDSFEIIHYPRLIPIDFLPFIPGIRVDNYKKIKNEYKSRFLGSDLDKKKIDSADVSKLYEISLKDDIALVGIKFDNSKGENCFKYLDENRRDFFIEEGLFKKLIEKKSDIARIDKEKNNESNTNDLTKFLSSIIDKNSNASNNKQDNASDKEKVKTLTTVSQDISSKPIELIINYTENIFDTEKNQDTLEELSLSDIPLNNNSYVSDNKGEPVISGDESLPKSEEKPTKKIENKNTHDISIKESENEVSKKKNRDKRKVKVYSSSAKAKAKDAVPEGNIKSKKDSFAFNSKITSIPNPNSVSPRKHGLSVVMLILLLCLLIGAWHSKDEVKNIYFKLYNGITEILAPRADSQVLPKKTNSDNTEHIDSKSDLLYDIDGSGKIDRFDRVQIMQTILKNAGYKQRIDRKDWDITKDNVRKYLKMNSVKFDEDKLEVDDCFEKFEEVHLKKSGKKK